MNERSMGDGEQLELFGPAARAAGPRVPELPPDADPDGEADYWSTYQSEFRECRVASPEEPIRAGASGSASAG